LFRYWNIIEYFFPYRYLIKEDWNKILLQFIPRFVNASNKREYLLACLELIGHIHDTHANVWEPGREMDSLKGINITPFRATFIEGKLVVTGYFTEWPAVKQKLKIGDVIEKIDNVPVDSLVRKFLPLTPASNYETQLRDLTSSSGFLLRNNKETAELSVMYRGGLQQITFPRIPLYKANTIIDRTDNQGAPAYKLLGTNIGYINPGKLKEEDLNSIKELFKDARGIIIDLRCYPSTFMPFTYGSWLKASSSPFACFTKSSLQMPGRFIYGNIMSNGGSGSYLYPEFYPTYKGKLIIIVNSTTQSQAEYTAMALSSVPKALIIGSMTAGADGDVSEVSLPGAVKTTFSGVGVYYPDLTETQRVGVKIDVPVHATIKGIREGRDEYLETAISFIK
jgi:hypothetical protein